MQSGNAVDILTSISRNSTTLSREWSRPDFNFPSTANVVNGDHGGLYKLSPPRRLGVTWKDVTVKAPGTGTTIQENVLSQFNVSRLAQESRHKPPLRTILHNSHGCVKSGEMLLVLGRPGSGCTTLLKILANQREGYSDVTGNVYYGSMPASEATRYPGQMVMNTVEDLFFPSLTVGQTIDFATRLKVSSQQSGGVKSAKQLQRETRDTLLESMGILHTSKTKIGNDFIRGVSGGERKRVSIAECLSTGGSIFFWDNSTRGLDASTAIEWAKTMRSMTDQVGLTSIATLYQASNAIYELFDKVLILDKGRQIYYGPVHDAKSFMESLGFICQDGANIADFLTGVVVPTERKVRHSERLTFPRTATAVKARYEMSSTYPEMGAESALYPFREETRRNTILFQRGMAMIQNQDTSNLNLSTARMYCQARSCIIRQYQIVWGDKLTFIVKQAFTIIQALIAGSLFFNAADDSSGLFIKTGAIFFSLLYNTLLSMTEITDSFVGRPILTKHQSFALHHPAAFCIAQVTADIPLVLFQISVFSLILYFMVGLTKTASAFFTFWIILVSVTLCMTALFRAIGAGFPTFDAAAKLAGLVITAFMLYTGYMIPKPNMHPWFVWIYWINPLSYALDALLSNELHRKVIECVGPNLVPNGPGYADITHQSCAGVSGAIAGQASLTGDQYLAALSYSYSNIWRNFGIIWVWWVLFALVTIAFTMKWKAEAGGGSTLLIPREDSKAADNTQKDEESQFELRELERADNSNLHDYANSGQISSTDTAMVGNSTVFTWRNISYKIKTAEGERVLLDNLQGWVKSGMLTTLMGSSGAGKTTLLDVLAQRKTDGLICGSILADGLPLPVSFQRSTGYCEQRDVHEPFATVREALEFSALLRQHRTIPRKEKLEYVDTIIDLLEMREFQNALVGTGLTSEQIKRVTLGVELVARPSSLIFLDEPTSGLDGQSAYNLVRFLRKLADAGQAILVTIHQPSSQVFSLFDTILLLNQGKTSYFGEIGADAHVLRDYLRRNGQPCPEGVNIAEHMISAVSGHASHGKDWNQVWLSSPECQAVTVKLNALIASAATQPLKLVAGDSHEFAVPLWEQIKIVTRRMNLSQFRNVDYINNKIALHLFTALFNGFSFWKIGNSVADLQLRLFTIFNFVFVAPGVINHMQPLFIQRRKIFETREKKSKVYSWVAFVTALIVCELPYICVCAVIYFLSWYFTVGFPGSPQRAGATFFVILIYEVLYTGIGQFEAAFSPNELFAALLNPLFMGILISFSGVLVPYVQIPAFWRYWLYWINPFNYLIGSLLVFDIWGIDVICHESELALFNPTNGTSCGEYLGVYNQEMGHGTRLLNPEALEGCRVCPYRTGNDFLQNLGLPEYLYGWRDASILIAFTVSSYALVYLFIGSRGLKSRRRNRLHVTVKL